MPINRVNTKTKCIRAFQDVREQQIRVAFDFDFLEKLKMNVFLSLYFILCLKLCAAISKHPIILTIAFDGFRYDYLNRGLTPILEEIAKNGTKAPYMMNQFPTITFPNFHSIMTGMHPETHGVIGNRAFNEKHQCLDYGYELFHYNEEIVPLWVSTK